MVSLEWEEVMHWRQFVLAHNHLAAASKSMPEERDFGTSLAGVVAGRLDGFARQGLFALCWPRTMWQRSV